jgi:hypothetical protein
MRMTNMRKVMAAAMAAILLGAAGCSSWQDRADNLQTALAEFVASGKTQKGDFIRLYGKPSGCSPLTTGEFCEWNTALDNLGGADSAPHRNAHKGQVLRFSAFDFGAKAAKLLVVEFDKSGRFVNGQFIVRRRGLHYLGHAESQAAAASPELRPLRRLFSVMKSGTRIRLTFLKADVPPIEGIFKRYHDSSWGESVVVGSANGGFFSTRKYYLLDIKSAESMETPPAQKPEQLFSVSTTTATELPQIRMKDGHLELIPLKNAP